MNPRPQQDPARVRQVIWYGMTGSIMMLGAVMFVIDRQLPRQPISPELEMILLGIACAGLFPFFVYRRIAGGRVISGGRPADPAQEQQRQLAQLIIGSALAELPLVVMLAYVAIGGQLAWGLAGWAASFGMLLMLRPESGRVI